VVGAVGHPLTEYVYAGVVGAGAWRESVSGERTAAAHVDAVAAAGHPAGRVQVAPVVAHRRGEARPADHRRDERRQHRLKIGLVSEALRDLYVYTGGRTKIWDTCGPEAVLTAAGGRMSDVDGNPLIYDQPDLFNRAVWSPRTARCTTS
jgi:3'(2'), 5'-bisphosphate nucleotidase